VVCSYGVRDYMVRQRGDRWLAGGDWNGPESDISMVWDQRWWWLCARAGSYGRGENRTENRRQVGRIKKWMVRFNSAPMIQ
jgi:hypothetical protein